MKIEDRHWLSKPFRELNPQQRQKFIFLIAIVWGLIMFFLVNTIGNVKNDPICCNCWGKGKVTAFGSTINCPYCYGSGYLSETTYNKKCK